MKRLIDELARMTLDGEVEWSMAEDLPDSAYLLEAGSVEFRMTWPWRIGGHVLDVSWTSDGRSHGWSITKADVLSEALITVINRPDEDYLLGELKGVALAKREVEDAGVIARIRRFFGRFLDAF
jgi:hypothetical protein